MAERIRRDHPVPQSVPAFLRLLASPDVVRARGAADGMATRLVAHEASAESVRIVTATDVPVDWLPGVVRSRLSGLPVVERTERWTRDGEDAHTRLEFSFSGLPVSADGSARVAPDGSGGRLTVDLTIRVGVRVVGALVERSLAPRLAAALDAEATFYAALTNTGTVAP